MAEWADWIPDIAPDVPGCPDPLIERAVQETVQDFCRRTRSLTRTVDDIDATAGANTFGAPLIEAGEYVVEVQRAWYLGKELDILTPDEVGDEHGIYDWKTRIGTPIALTQEREDAFWLAAGLSTTVADALTMRAAIGYTDAATTCDDLLRRERRYTIRDGARARLLVMSQSWKSADLASVCGAAYESAVASATVQSVRRSPRRRQRWKTAPAFY